MSDIRAETETNPADAAAEIPEVQLSEHELEQVAGGTGFIVDAVVAVDTAIKTFAIQTTVAILDATGALD